MVGHPREDPLPGRHPAADLRRRRWIQRPPGPGLEGRTRQVHSGHRATGHGLSSATRGFQMEQNRTPDVLPDHDELAWPAPCEPTRSSLTSSPTPTTTTGLRIQCVLDTREYPTGAKYTAKDVDALPLTRHDFHPDWNYTLRPTDTP